MKKILFSITAAMVMSATTVVAQKVVTIENKGGKQTTFEERNSNSLSFEENLAIISGERMAYNTKHTGLDGCVRERTTLYGLGGVALVNKAFAPQATLGISHSFFPNVDLGLQGEYSRAKY
jgi:hypothetical protein